MDESRPSKKQRELLQFIDGFIKGYGYGPSYREIMRALNYKSVSTVAIHVDNLIAKGHLIKKDNSARSLAVVAGALPATKTAVPKGEADIHRQWLIDRVQMRIDAYHKKPDDSKKAHLETLIETVRLLIDNETAEILEKKLEPTE
jgi:repressor LexA